MRKYDAVETFRHFENKKHWNDLVRVLPEQVPQSWLARKWHWIKFRLVWRWTAEYFEKIELTTTRTVSVDSIRDSIRKTANSLRLICRDKCKHVIVGPAQAMDLRQEQVKDFPMCSFGVNYEIYRDGAITEYGLTVHVVPWFDGVLLLPELETKAATKPQYREE